MTDAEKREEAARLYEIAADAKTALHELDHGEHSAEVNAAVNVLLAIKRAKERDIHMQYSAEIHRIYEAEPVSPEVVAVRTASKAADLAYEAFDAPSVMTDGEGEVVRCAKTDVPIFEDDEVVDDPETGETFLRSALGLPPRPADPSEEEEAA